MMESEPARAGTALKTKKAKAKRTKETILKLKIFIIKEGKKLKQMYHSSEENKRKTAPPEQKT